MFIIFYPRIFNSNTLPDSQSNSDCHCQTNPVTLPGSAVQQHLYLKYGLYE